MMVDGRLLLIDGDGLTQFMQQAHGREANTVSGFIYTMLLHLLSKNAPDYLAVAFGKTEASPQPRLKHLLQAAHVPIIEMAGYEACDVIGTIVGQCQASQTQIVTPNRRLLQLVSPSTSVICPSLHGFSQAEQYDIHRVQTTFQVTPQQLGDWLALVGYRHIAGVKGIGRKTAVKLLNSYHSLAGIYAHLAQIGGTIRRHLQAGQAAAYRWQRLVQITTDLPLKLEWASWAVSRFDFTAVSKRLSCLPDLQTLAARLKNRHHAPSIPATHAHTICTQTEGHLLATTLSQAQMISITVGEGITLATAPGTVYTIPLNKLPIILPILQPALTNPHTPKLIDNATTVIPLLTQMGVAVTPITFDPMIADRLLYPGTQAATLDELAQQWLDMPMTTTAADTLLRLYAPMQQAIREQGLEDVMKLEMALVPVVAAMQAVGMGVDVAFWRQMRQQVDGRLHTLDTTIQQQVGIPFDVRSSQATSEALFWHLGLPTEGIPKRGDTYTITKATLLKLQPHAPDLIPLILAYREWAHLKRRYLNVLPEKVQNGRLHTHFDQLGTITGRITSHSPNLQTIPIRSENGRQLRRGFVAKPGHVLLAADYAQFELRILAHLSQDENLLAILRQGGDVHRQTAATVYDIPPEAVTPDQRRMAKTINFGLLYGMGVTRLAREMGVSREKAVSFMAAYDGRFPGVRAYLNKTKARAKRQGYLQTILGRRRAFPIFEDEKARGSHAWQQAEREAMNYPLQGSAADIIKLAMVRLHETLTADYRARMILQVHDELLLEVPEEEAEAVTAVVREVMADAYPLDLPLEVKVRVGKDWLDL